MSEWHSIETAPKDGSTIWLKTEGGAELKASFQFGFEREDGVECGAWCADYWTPAPECWTDGVCWQTNEDGKQSDMPKFWRRP